MTHVSEINELRGEVARLRRAATRKISRIKQTHGAEVSGTKFDPRRSTTAPRQYTEKQLRAYRESLTSFLDRRNQFVPAANREPVPRAEFNRYKQLEQQYARNAGSVYERLKDTELPSGQTVAERLAAMTPKHRTMHNTAANRIFDPVTREPGDVASRDALRKLTKNLERAASPAMVRRKVNQAREQINQMFDTLNMPELRTQVNNLTNDQLVALWNLTGFATKVSLSYENAKRMLSPKEQSWGHEQLRQSMADAMEDVEWARRVI